MANENLLETTKYKEITFLLAELQSKTDAPLSNELLTKFKKAIELGKIIIDNGTANAILTVSYISNFNSFNDKSGSVYACFGGVAYVSDVKDLGATLKLVLNLSSNKYTSYYTEI